MRLSIIIPAYNEEAFLADTICKIKAAIHGASGIHFDWELIVCDNNSTDRTAEIARDAGAIVVSELVNQIAKARNAAAAVATGDWLLFIDADTYPSSELLTDALTHAQSGDYIGCGTTIRIEGGSRLNKFRLESLNPTYRLIQMSGGAFLLIEAQAFRSLNGFSDDLHALEEVEFLKRLKRYGRKQNKRFIVLHKHPVTTSGRKDDLTIKSLAVLFFSNFLALTYYFLYLILPRKLLPKLSNSLLRYWYPVKR